VLAEGAGTGGGGFIATPLGDCYAPLPFHGKRIYHPAMHDPEFPALLALHGDDDLLYLASPTQWQEEADRALRLLPDQDRLIDGQGRVFRPFPAADGYALRGDGERIDLEAFNRMLRRHLFAQARTCIAKAEVASVAEGIGVVRELG